jgi:hypothetical protein
VRRPLHGRCWGEGGGGGRAAHGAQQRHSSTRSSTLAWARHSSHERAITCCAAWRLRAKLQLGRQHNPGCAGAVEHGMQAAFGLNGKCSRVNGTAGSRKCPGAQ